MAKRIEFTEIDIANMYDLYYNQNLSFREVAEKYNCSEGVIKKRFKEKGWKGHNRAYKFIKYSVNEHLFDKIDSANKAYCLGLWYADGCNHGKTGEITMELQINDYDVLESINKFIENTRLIKIYLSENKLNRKLDTCVMAIHSHYLCEHLSELNFVPRKSLILDFPYWMDKELIPYMLRGYIDGDGWVQKYVIGFMSTDKFCIGVKQYLDDIGIESHIMNMKGHYNKHTKTLYIQGKKNMIPLTNLMFSDGDIFMQRKVKRYIEYGFLDSSINNSLVA